MKKKPTTLIQLRASLLTNDVRHVEAERIERLRGALEDFIRGRFSEDVEIRAVAVKGQAEIDGGRQWSSTSDVRSPEAWERCDDL